jgi:hypothetical protein
VAYRKLEDLPVWQAAIELAVRILDQANEGVFRAHPGLRDQFGRAVLSISNNIAEGYEAARMRNCLHFSTTHGGQRARNQNDATRRIQEAARRQAAFVDELRRVKKTGRAIPPEEPGRE